MSMNFIFSNIVFQFVRLNVTPVESWGFPVNNTKQYDGVIGLLQSGDIEIASASLVFKTPRLDVLDYAGETVSSE